MRLQKIIDENKTFLKGEPNVYFSPGRVNLIGEHIDYLGGNVFPSAISLGTYAFVTKRDDNEFHFLSANFKKFGEKIITLDQLEYSEAANWANYGKGVFSKYLGKGHTFPHGLNILVFGTLPNSSGLSSSASLELLIIEVIKNEFNLNIDKLEAVIDAKDIENNFIGVNCGIMDQFAIGMAEKNHAIYLDTNSLEYEQVPFELGDYTLLIANTNKKRALADSKYNERVNECKNALEALQRGGVTISALCELNGEALEKHKHLITNEIERNRTIHAVYENERTNNAVIALKQGDIKTFGRLMNESHNSLRDLYEVSCKELDTLVDSFRANGAIGARMTGAGFGGCAIAISKKEDAKRIIKAVEEAYVKEIGHQASFFDVSPSGGPQKIEKDVL